MGTDATSPISGELWTGFTADQRGMLVVAVLLVAAWIVGRVAATLLRGAGDRVAKRDRHGYAGTLRGLSVSGPFFAFAAGFRLAASFVPANVSWTGFLRIAAGVMLTVAMVQLALGLTDTLASHMRQRARKTDTLDDMFVPLVRNVLRVLIWVLAVLQLIQLFIDRPMTSIVAGLGVGGLAVALAAQDTLKNFFGSLLLYADRPFRVGDRIVVDDIDGPVEQVGLRSTRIRTLAGELVAIPNGDLAAKAIRNIGRRPHIRRVMDLSLEYGTPPGKVRRAKAILEELLRGHEGAHADYPPRVFFDEFRPDSLNLKVIYWYHPPEYWNFMAYSERLNLQILERFEAEGIAFAFPTQTVHLAAPRAGPAAPPS